MGVRVFFFNRIANRYYKKKISPDTNFLRTWYIFSKEEKRLTSTRINTEILREVVADETNFSRIPHGNKVDFWTGVAARVNKVVKKNKWDEEGEDLKERVLDK